MGSVPVVDSSEFAFHHARPLQFVTYGVVQQAYPSAGTVPSDCSKECDWSDGWHSELTWELGYEWLAKNAGYWPLFVSIGWERYSILATGYGDQWRRIMGWGPDGTRYRVAGTAPNSVLFSFRDLAGPLHFSDIGNWCVVLNSVRRIELAPWHELEPISPFWERLILKPSWSRADWLRRARRSPGTVQAVVPDLDLRAADQVLCRNAATRKHLLALGFGLDRVKVRRVRCSWED